MAKEGERPLIEGRMVGLTFWLGQARLALTKNNMRRVGFTLGVALILAVSAASLE